MKLKDNFTAYLFLMPFLCIFTVFLLVPVFYSFWLSFYKVGVYTDLFDVFSKMEWVGWSNYIDLLKDGEFRWSMILTLFYAGMTIPGTIFVSLLLALILNSGLFGKAFFRSAFFLPNVLDMLVVGFIWQLIYSPKFGILTKFL